MVTIAAPVYDADHTLRQPMPAKTEQSKETWESWLPENTSIPDEALLTREELIARLHRNGVEISAKDLSNWQAAGVIPYGVVGWHEATRKTRALYPDVMLLLISQLRAMQREGLKLQEIGPRLRSLAFMTAILNEPEAIGAEHRDARPWFETPVENILQLKAPLMEIARKHSRQMGRRVTRVDVRLNVDPDMSDNRVAGLSVNVIDETGALFTYDWP